MPDIQPDTEPAYARLAEKIRCQILAGELPAGQQLPTEALMSARYSVGRNTAREALRLLTSQGLVTIRRGVTGGAFVTRPTPTQTADSVHTALTLLSATRRLTPSQVFEVREMLEVPASEMAAFHRTKEELDALNDSLLDDISAPCPDGLHEGILAATRNPLLTALANPMVRATADFFRSGHTSGRIHAEHLEILHHLEIQDQAGAREATRAHLRSLRQIMHSAETP